MNILDLPDEILITIFNKLNITDVFDSLIDVNERLNQLVLDPLYIRDLNLTTKSLLDTISPIDGQVLVRICERILPRINDQVNKLTVDSLSIERVFSTNEYPQLRSLSLVNFQEETLLQHLTNDTILHRLLANQITSLDIAIKDEITPESDDRNESNLFAMILSKCKYLNHLSYSQWFTDQNLTNSLFDLPSTSCVSSSLTKLNIFVNTLDDCLYILDGRFQCLSTLTINVIKVFAALSNFDNTVIHFHRCIRTKNIQLIKLLFLFLGKTSSTEIFSLKSYCPTYFYDNRIIPLLHRMSNLEELTLFIYVIRLESTYIDGTHLYDEILSHMPRLSQFTFCISTTVYNINVRIDLPSNDDVQRSFIQSGKEQVGSYVMNNPTKIKGECRIYSLPYQFDDFLYLTSAFPGGRFNQVRCLVMVDMHPFERSLFQIIARDFPFLRRLRVLNSVAQTNKQYSSTPITFNHLVELHLALAHADYIKQFLVKENTHLPRLFSLHIQYETLAMITNNFTNDPTRLNCTQLKYLDIKESFVRPENFHSYFPLL